MDPATICGEGGAHDVRLVVPVSLEMFAQPPEEQLALTRLSGSLHTDQTALPHSRVALADSRDLIYNMPVRSVPQGSIPHTVELRFPLSMSVIEKLEGQRLLECWGSTDERSSATGAGQASRGCSAERQWSLPPCSA